MRKEFIVAQIIPTGLGASIGGYVGDATPATNLIATVADKVISHPNVVNGVELDVAKENVLYVDGFNLDRLFLGDIALREVRANKIGVVLDSGYKERESIDIALNTIDAIKTVKGVNIIGYTFTEKPVGGRAVKNKSGTFVGEIEDQNIFLKAAGKLIKKGANAIAISTVIKISYKDLEKYFKGKGPNPYGGTEAIISYTISMKFGIPSAHAPLLTLKEIKHEMFSGVIDPRAGAEAISPAYLGCVLQGLHKAPQPVPIEKSKESDIRLEDISAVILPASCLGGIPALCAEKNNIPIIAVEENKTVLNVTKEKLKLKNVIKAKNYLEVAGILACMKEGIDYKMVERPVSGLRRI